MLSNKGLMRLLIIVVVWDPRRLLGRWSYSYLNCSVTLLRRRSFLILFLLIHKLLILLPCLLHLLLSLISLLALSLQKFFPVPLEFGLEPLFLLNLLPLLFFLSSLLLINLVLQHPLQILFLLLLPLVLHLRYFRKPVHWTRNRRPGVLKRLLKWWLVVWVDVSLTN